jgi:hypothetical protein
LMSRGLLTVVSTRSTDACLSYILIDAVLTN